MSAANVRAEMTSAFASEVVTHAKMRLVDLPLGPENLRSSLWTMIKTTPGPRHLAPVASHRWTLLWT